MSLAGWEHLALAFLLLLIGAGLLLLEFTVVSWGLLTVAALVAAGFGVWLAFSVNTLAGWLFLLVVPVLATIATRLGLRGLRAAGAVVEAQTDSDAGYRHVAEAIGVSPGSRGELVTDALPTGRARFAGGEVDIVVSGNSLPRGRAVVVLRIEGPLVVVSEVR